MDATCGETHERATEAKLGTGSGRADDCSAFLRRHDCDFCARHRVLFGSFTGALFTGAVPILAVFYVCIGAKISVSSLPQFVRKGGVSGSILWITDSLTGGNGVTGVAAASTAAASVPALVASANGAYAQAAPVADTAGSHLRCRHGTDSPITGAPWLGAYCTQSKHMSQTCAFS